MKSTNYILIAIVFLVVGMLAGYALGENRPVSPFGTSRERVGQDEYGDMMNMMDAMGGMMMGLGRTGDEFDKAFLSGMIVHHQGAINMAEASLRNAKHAEIKDLARNIIEAQTREIELMREWQRAWYSD